MRPKSALKNEVLKGHEMPLYKYFNATFFGKIRKLQKNIQN
jgi:hypothetical protein